MGNYNLLMPRMGESVMEATILAWHKKPGDQVAVDEIILEVATDKVDTDVPSPVSGIIKEILHHVGDVVPVDKPLAIITIEGEEDEEATEIKQTVPAETIETSAPVSAPTEPELKPEPEIEVPYTPVISPEPSVASSKSVGRYYSPLVLNIAQTEGIPLSELEKVPGTGLEGRITKDDILLYVKQRPTMKSTVQAEIKTPEITTVKESSVMQHNPVQMGIGNETIEMDRVRKLIAKNMISSQQISAHVTSIVEADLTNIVKWREKHKKSFFEREGIKLTYMPIFVEAIAKAIRDFPMINISVDGDKIIKKHDINIGIATALPNGNLIVPVIKQADRLNLGGIASSIHELVSKARSNRLSADDIDGGTYTITNIGTFGNIIGTAIIPQPQVAIMSVGIITKKPVVMETEVGDVIAIRQMMYLSHTYDHRVVDGMLGGQFVRRVADYLEQFDLTREL